MLDDRNKQVLLAIIDSYINKPEPVGSRFVQKRYSFNFSPATIRNIMADLEDLGFLNQPHASAGRIPTDKGYRFYVDSLLDNNASFGQDNDLCDQINRFSVKMESIRNNVDEMFLEVSHTLSTISNYIGIAFPPRHEKMTLNKIDLIRYKGSQVAAILITDEGVIKNRMLTVDPGLTQNDLNRITDYLNSEYSGCCIDEIKGDLLKKLSHEKILWDQMIEKAIRICEDAISFAADDFFISGLYDAMNLPDFSDISRLKEIARAIKDKHLIFNLLHDLADTGGIQVLIGNENQAQEFRNLSIVASTYKEGDRTMGVIAVIGPTRMNYPRAIYMVDNIARCISDTLKRTSP